jgi:predicted dehydrogenase
VRWGILSTGHITHSFAKAVLECEGESLAAVASRRNEQAQAFADQYKIPTSYDSYEALLADKTIEAVYIGTPHPFHAEWSIKASKAGKHVLCEKPLAMNVGEVRNMLDAAQEHHVLLMEAFMYRCHPQTHRLLQVIQKGLIGQVKVIRSSFSFDRDLGLQHRLFNKDLGGGGILDLGCYPVSMSRLLAGAAMGKPYAEPDEVLAAACLGEKSGVDEYASAVLRFPGGILAELSCGIRVERESGTLVVYGSEGRLEVPSPWHCGLTAGETELLRYRNGTQVPEAIKVLSDKGIYALEVEAFSESVRAGCVSPPAMTPEDSLGNMAVLEKWLKTAK